MSSPSFSPSKHVYEIVDIIEGKGPDSRYKIFKLLPKDKRIDYTAGQFINVYKLNEDGTFSNLFRAYSIASHPDMSYIELAIKMVNGTFTSYLDKVEIGENVGIEGPYGHMNVENVENAIFIGGGIGITPMISMARYIEYNNIKGNFYLFYSTRHLSGSPYISEILSYGNVKGIITLTRENREGFKTGHIDENMLRKYISEDLGKFRAYICGSSKMALSLKETLKLMGVNESNISIEAWE